MPLLAFTTGTENHLDKFYSAFAKAGARYIFPASITLFGDGPGTHKTLMMRAIDKNFPELIDTYRNLFADGYQVDNNYHKALSRAPFRGEEKIQHTG